MGKKIKIGWSSKHPLKTFELGKRVRIKITETGKPKDIDLNGQIGVLVEKHAHIPFGHIGVLVERKNSKGRSIIDEANLNIGEFEYLDKGKFK